MKRWLLVASLLLPWSFAQAAPLSAPCLQTGPTSVQCDPVNSTNPMPVTSGTPSSSSAVAATQAKTAALAANLVVKASAGNLYGFEVSADSTLSAAAWWIMIYDATSAPADGAVTPAKCYALPLGATLASFSFPVPVPFGTGIVIGVSTNGCFTKAASTHAFISGDYK